MLSVLSGKGIKASLSASVFASGLEYPRGNPFNDHFEMGIFVETILLKSRSCCSLSKHLRGIMNFFVVDISIATHETNSVR